MNDFLQTQACAFVSGAMTQEEREEFELILEFNPELRAFTGELADVGVALTLASQPAAAPCASLKGRIAALIADRPQRTTPEGLVMSGPDGLVRWVNPAFSEMCGYTLEELRGKKLGPILQGKDTDRGAAGRMRRAVQEYRPCSETILNYHKNGSPYWVEVSIKSIFDEEGRPLWLVARERELKDHAA